MPTVAHDSNDRFRVFTSRDIRNSTDTRTSWGAWRLVRQTLAYQPNTPRRTEYSIELRRCRTPEQLLGWLGQLAEKDWVPSSALGDLVRAFDSIIGLRSAR